MTSTEFVYTTYIRTTPEKLWHALTNREFMKQYWFGCHCESDFKVGSPWKLVLTDGNIADAGEILESNPPKRLVIKWHNQWKPDMKAEGWSRCSFDIEQDDGAVKLTVSHSIDKAPPSKLIEGVSGGWPKILSNLKSLLETGQIALKSKSGCKAA
jgi:uncharacterized protein YndB with AHSA1/START domain